MEKVKFETSREDGENLELTGNYWKADSDAGVVLSHGYTGDKSEWGYLDFIARELNGSGYNVLAFDFAGSGESDDEPLRIDRQVHDLGVAREYLESRGVDNIGLYGHSQGGLVSLRNSEDVEAIFLTSPVTDSLADYADDRLTEKQQRELEENGYWTKTREKGVRDKYVIDEEIIRQKENLDQEKLLSGTRCTVRIIHGTEDSVVPVEASRKAVQKLENADLKEVEGLTHSYDTKLDKIAEYAVEFFEKEMPPETGKQN
ncbi:hypothetical protein AQV86_01555 [Nanohaloarchaea archaeon SG9]|nr:hypothetical protein AQV86_01555 [Nanohaloarchaea archaeon SG9]